MKANPSQLSNYFSGKAIAIFMLAALLGACSSPVDPIDGGGEEIIGDQETLPKSYNVRMKFKRIEIMGDCDGDNLGITNKGEFAYRVSYSLQNSDGSWTSKRIVSQTAHFGEADGEIWKKGDQGVFTIDETVVQNLADGLNYRMHVSAIEWDALVKDSRMDGATATEENSAGGSKLNYTHKLDLGSSPDCRVRLHVIAEEQEV